MAERYGAAILGPEGLRLTDWESAFFREYNPFGFILFARNIETPEQVKRLCADLREVVQRDAPVFIDQEGGRVQRMRAPHWREYLPPLEQVERARDPVRAMWLRYRLIAAELRAVGIDGNCAPCADVASDLTHPFLRNRCYGTDPAFVTDLARTVAQAHLAGGVLPVIKHIPGHGRATVDSHKSLPRVRAPRTALESTDFAPFRALADLPMAMTAHVVFDEIDVAHPATTSRVMIDLIREDIGFGGLLMSDDISMEALSGDVAQRTRAAIDAGCDVVLHCNGDHVEIAQAARAAGQMTDAAQIRAQSALTWRKSAAPVDIAALTREFEQLVK